MKIFYILFLVLIFFCCISAQDRQTAEKASAEAEKLQSVKTAESLQNAVKKYEEALAIWRELGDKTKESVTFRNIGVIYLQLGNANRAIESFNGSLTAARALGDKELEAYALLYLGQGYDILGDSRRQTEYYNQALQIARETKNLKIESDALGSLGVAYYRLGELQTALNYYNESLPVLRALKVPDGEAILLANIAAIYISLGKPQSAIDNYLQALPIFRELKDVQNEAVVLGGIGSAFADLKEYEKSLEYNTQSLVLRRKIGDRRGEAVALGGIGGTYFNLGENQKALEFYEQSLTIFREIKARRSEGNTLNNIGRICLNLKDFGKAFEYFSQSLTIRRETGDLYGESVTLHNLAFVERERGNLNESRQFIEKAIEIVESIRAALASNDLRQTYFALSQDMYKFQIDLLMSLHAKQPDKNFDALALQTSERARARGLLDILAEAKADIRQDVDAGLLEREKILQKQIGAKDNERRRAQTAEQKDALDKELQKLTNQYQELQAEIKLKSPHYAALTQPKPADLKEIQALLDDETILLEYALGTEKSYLWVVSNSGLKTFILPKRADIEAKARELYEAVKKPDSTEKANNSAKDLSKILLEPVANELKNKRLAIVADGILQYVPFGALSVVRRPSSVANAKDKGLGCLTGAQASPLANTALFSGVAARPLNQFEFIPNVFSRFTLNASETLALQSLCQQNLMTNDEPLIVSNEIINLPSASTLSAIRNDLKDRKSAPKTVAVIADPVFESDDVRINRNSTNQTAKTNPTIENATRNAGFTLARLPGTRREAATILSLVPDTEKKRATDFEANRAVVFNAELADYRIIHFATHGLLNAKNPELSGIVLSLFDEKGNAQDGFLRLNEIYNLKLPADLIVLSACQTALGKDVRGEGLISLTRGFMYAGAPRIVASLWAVDDRATGELMKLFYQAMLGEKKLRPAAALREAQIQMWKTKRFSAPYFWSAFTIQGEWR